MKRCPYCGREVSDTARACGHCGRSLAAGPAGAAVAPQADRRCPYCREPVSPTARACGNCGEWLEPGRAPRRRARRGLPVWAFVLFGLLAAALVAGVTYALVTGRLGREAAPAAATQAAFAPVGAATEPVRIPAATDSEPAATVAKPPATDTPLAVTATPDEPTVTPVPPTATPAPAETVLPTEAPTEAPTETPTEAPTEAPTPEPTAADTLPAVLPGRIAFPAFDAERGTYDLYVARPDGSGLQRVMDQASQPALSPDGQRLAFRRWRSDDRGIEVMNTAGGGQQRLSNFLEDALPSWSPDGETLVFFSRRESDRGSRVYQVKATGGGDWELKRGVDPVWGEYPTWQPDGAIVYRSTWPDVGLAVMSGDGDGSGEAMIFADGSATAPAVSPDGRFIALMSQRDGNWEIYRLNGDGSGLLRLTNHGGNDGLPAWSPDGSAIAFVSDRDGNWAIWAMTPGGQGQRRLFALPGSPDGVVGNEPDFSSRGWAEERISWGP